MIINASSHQIPLAGDSVHAIVTSPPYFGLRKYDGAQDVSWPAGSYAPMTGCPPCVDVPAMACPFGNEPTIEAYVWHSLLILRECRRVLRDDGVLWWNIGDSYSSGTRTQRAETGKHLPVGNGAGRSPVLSAIEDGNLLGIPHRVMLAAHADGWTVRNDCVWAKVAPMPESVKGWKYDAEGNLTRGSWRHTRAHEFVFQMVKGMGYFSDGEAVKERASRGAAGSTFTNGKTGINGAGRVGQRDRSEDGARNPRSVLTPPAVRLQWRAFRGFSARTDSSADPRQCAASMLPEMRRGMGGGGRIYADDCSEIGTGGIRGQNMHQRNDD